jgi:molecular chaperone HtpG
MSPALLEDAPELAVFLEPDPEARTLAVSDNGVGMGHAELVQNLGTIAHSGSQRFLEELAAAKAKSGKAKGEGGLAPELALIGQFGVGFYAAFMVADKVEVFSRKAGEARGWRWESDGRSGFSVEPAEGLARGTRVVLHLKKGEDEYLEPARLRGIVKTYSDHIALPIRLIPKPGAAPETVNAASALWTRPKAEISSEQYREFYHHVAHAFDEPWLTLHLHAEGKIEYSALLFVPGAPPLGLFDPDRKPRLKLYVKRVFITDDCDALVPPYLRFLRGIVDSNDLPLNVSREMLQDNPLIRKIRAGLTKRVLSELAKKAEKKPEAYAAFWKNFGAVLKEGLYEDPEQRETILKLARFASSREPGALTGLADYVAHMKEGQGAIYYIAGDDSAALAKSPHLEGFRSHGVEILFMTDPVDEFWLPALGAFEGRPFRSVTRGAADLSALGEPKGAAGESAKDAAGAEIGALIALVKLALGDAVKDVRASERLTDSPVCLVADEGDLDIHLERLLRQHKRLDRASKRILELNPRHPAIRALGEAVGRDGTDESLADAAWLLFDQARILEGEPIEDPAAFAKRLSGAIARGFASAAR